jgi:hypothetical protein
VAARSSNANQIRRTVSRKRRDAISAHTMSSAMRPISVEMRKPMQRSRAENFGAIAPIRASVVQILARLKMKGPEAAALT